MTQHHDPVHPDSDHLTAELLADLDEGLLDAESAEHARAHLAHCAKCQHLHQSLRDLTSALQELPEEAMPDQVWRNLKEALEAEQTAAAAAAGTATSAATVTPLDSARSEQRSWVGRTWGAVAVAAGVLFVGALIVPGLLDTSNGDSSSGATADADPEAAGEVSSANGDSLAQYAISRSGRQYQEAELDAQVTQLVAAKSADNGYDTPDVVSSDAAPASESTQTTPTPTSSSGAVFGAGDLKRSSLLLADAEDAAVAAKLCLDQYLLAPGVAPLAIDIGEWKGHRAAIVVLPIADDPTKIEVWVINPVCADKTGDVQVWHYQQLDAAS